MNACPQRVLEELDMALHEAQFPVLWASGGARSLILLHLLRHRRAWDIPVLHVERRLDATQNLARLLREWGYEPPYLLQPGITLDAFFERYSVPTSGTFENRLRNWKHCRFRALWMPLTLATHTLASTLVIGGSKAGDPSGEMGDKPYLHLRCAYGFDRINPLWHWTDEEVCDYIDAHTIELPASYRGSSTALHPQADGCLGCIALKGDDHGKQT